jgi:hypothetical protein
MNIKGDTVASGAFHAEGRGGAAFTGGVIAQAQGNAVGSTYASAEGLVVHRSGAKQQYDWETAMQYLRGVLDKRGDPTDPKESCDGWRSEADAARLVQTYMVDVLQTHLPEDQRKIPDFRTVKRYVAPELKRWREAQLRVMGHNQ